MLTAHSYIIYDFEDKAENKTKTKLIMYAPDAAPMVPTFPAYKESLKTSINFTHGGKDLQINDYNDLDYAECFRDVFNKAP